MVGAVDIEELGLSGPLLGPFAATWATRAAHLDAGDLLVVYTDGLIEARNSEGKEFGMDRMMDLVAGRRAQGPEAVVDELLVAVRGFSGARLVDDLTLVITSLDLENSATNPDLPRDDLLGIRANSQARIGPISLH